MKDDTLCTCNPTGSYNFDKKMTDKTPEEPKQLFRLEDLFEGQIKQEGLEYSFIVHAIPHNCGSLTKSFNSQEQAEEFIKELKEAKYGHRIELYELTIKRLK